MLSVMLYSVVNEASISICLQLLSLDFIMLKFSEVLQSGNFSSHSFKKPMPDIPEVFPATCGCSSYENGPMHTSIVLIMYSLLVFQTR